MSTAAPAQVVYLSNEWEKLYPTAAISGIVGDAAHAARGGYHISIQDQPSDNYSVTRKDDKAPPGDWPRNMASAVDMTLSLNDMKKCHARLKAAWQNRSTDERMKYINAWNGWDGNGSPGRYDVVTGTVGTASDDHKWHVHLEVRRRYVNDKKAMDAILSVLRGETLEEYLGDDLVATDADIQKIAKAVWDVDYMPSGDPANPEWQAKTLISYRLNALPAALSALAADVATLKTAVAAIGGVDVDEVALGAAIANNATFVGALASAVVAKLPVDKAATKEDVVAAIKSALNGTKLSAV